MRDTCLCPHCRDLVDVPRVPFRYELTPCPKCGSRMFEEDMLLEILGKGYLVTDRPSALTCPKCNNAKICFHDDAHLHVLFGLDFPAVGDLVDGCITSNGGLDIPWFTLALATVDHDIPVNLKPGQRITMRVTAITTATPTDPVHSMIYREVVTDLGLEFLNTLPDNHR